MLRRSWAGLAVAVLVASCSTGLADVDSTLPAENLEELVDVVAARVEEVRNLSFQSVPSVRVLADPEFEEALVSGSGYGAERLGGDAAFLRLLGMLGAADDLDDLDYALARSASARYFPGTNEIVVRDYGLTPLMQGVLARHLTHALQVQNFPPVENASGLAWTEEPWILFAIAEGDARRVENQYLALNLTLEEQVEHARLAAGEAPGTRTGLPAVLELRLAGAEAVGEEYVRRTTNAARDEMLLNPPASSEQMLRTGSRDEPVAVSLTDFELGGYRVFDEGVFGEHGFDTLFAAGLDDPVAQVRASQGWGGDGFRIYVDDTGRAAAVFVVVLDSESDAAEFEQAWRQLILNSVPDGVFVDVTRTGAEVTVILASDDASGVPLAEEYGR